MVVAVVAKAIVAAVAILTFGCAVFAVEAPSLALPVVEVVESAVGHIPVLFEARRQLEPLGVVVGGGAVGPPVGDDDDDDDDETVEPGDS